MPGSNSLSSFELWNRIEAALGLAIPLPRFVEAATLEALVELACALAEEPTRAAISDTQAPNAAEQAQTKSRNGEMLPREQWMIDASKARMTSDEGQRALNVSLAVVVEPAIDQAAVCAAWQQALPAGTALHTNLKASPAGDATLIALRAARTHFDSWSAALMMEDLLARLGGSSREAKPQSGWQQRRAVELAQLDGANRTGDIAFWSEMLKDAPWPLTFAQRSRALAPVGFGLNRGPTARVGALLGFRPAGGEGAVLAAFARALADVTGQSDFLIACDIDRREPETANAVIGPLATTLPLVCRVDATVPPEALAARLGRGLRHARAHDAFDLAACEDAFGAAWRAAGIAPRQIGFRYLEPANNRPALLTASSKPLRFGQLTVRRSNADGNSIENDLRLAVTPAEDGAHAEIAYDREVASDDFAQALLDACVRELRGNEEAPASPELSAQTPR